MNPAALSFNFVPLENRTMALGCLFTSDLNECIWIYMCPAILYERDIVNVNQHQCSNTNLPFQRRMILEPAQSDEINPLSVQGPNLEILQLPALRCPW